MRIDPPHRIPYDPGTMKLNVVESSEPWYSGGLNFTCTQCGNCCTGGPGYVWISGEEIVRLGAYLKITPEQVVERYCRKFGGKLTLDERRTPQGNFDCIFLKEEMVAGGKAAVPVRRRICTIYPVRPLQCRTWPFWPEIIKDPEAWKRAGGRCPGMGRGARHFTREQIESLRNAEEWPTAPPSSDP